MPDWLRGDVLDIRTLVLECLHATQTSAQVCCLSFPETLTLLF